MPPDDRRPPGVSDKWWAIILQKRWEEQRARTAPAMIGPFRRTPLARPPAVAQAGERLSSAEYVARIRVGSD
jgi:hypothetical protein